MTAGGPDDLPHVLRVDAIFRIDQSTRARWVDEMNWIEIKTQADADALMELFGGFHDACIREAHFWTDHWVSKELSMAVSPGLDNRIRFLIQRQFRDPAAIELLFDEVKRINLVPAPENHDSIILRATLVVRDGTIFWSPEGDWSPDSPQRDNSTWVSAMRLRWREVDWLGKELHYGPRED